MATDPVCGMSVEPTQAAAKADHAGTAYYFCCEGCRKAFVADPQKYARAEADNTAGGPSRPHH